MTNEEKIITILEKQAKLLENLQAGQEKTHTILAQHTTALKALGAGHQDLVEQVQTLKKTVATAKDVDFTVEAAKREIQSDLNAVTAHVIRQVQSNTQRITALEEHTGAENPNKH